MKKREVTDEMVKRFIEYSSIYTDAGARTDACTRTCVREGLEAALNPPPEPEVTVTREQTQAGLWAFYHEDELPNPEPWRSEFRHREMANAYRAMRRLEPKGVNAGTERRTGPKDRRSGRDWTGDSKRDGYSPWRARGDIGRDTGCPHGRRSTDRK